MSLVPNRKPAVGGEGAVPPVGGSQAWPSSCLQRLDASPAASRAGDGGNKCGRLTGARVPGRGGSEALQWGVQTLLSASEAQRTATKHARALHWRKHLRAGGP